MSNINLNTKVTLTEGGSIYVEMKTFSLTIPYKVFAIEVLPKSRDKYTPEYRLSHICSPVELAELPEDEPDDSSYFRTDEISMLFDTPIIADEAIKLITNDITKLDNEYSTLVEIISGGTVHPGPGPGPGPEPIPDIYYEDL